MNPDDSEPAHDEAQLPIATDADDPLDPTGQNNRLWLRTILQILQLSTSDPPPSPRVQFALDQVEIAACERAIRILSSDLASPSV